MVEVFSLEVEWCLLSHSLLPPATVADGVRHFGVMGLRGMAPRPLVPIAVGHEFSTSSDHGQRVTPGGPGMCYMRASLVTVHCDNQACLLTVATATTGEMGLACSS